MCRECVCILLLDLMKCPAVVLSWWMCWCVQVLQAVRPSQLAEDQQDQWSDHHHGSAGPRVHVRPKQCV